MERHPILCSGYAKGRDLFEIVKTINRYKKMPFPIHTDRASGEEVCEGYYY